VHGVSGAVDVVVGLVVVVGATWKNGLTTRGASLAFESIGCAQLDCGSSNTKPVPHVIQKL
jgi:hypothetical protein